MSSEFPQSKPPKEKYPAPELEAHRYRARKRKYSPHIEAFFKVIRQDPDVWSDLKPTIDRRKDFLPGTSAEGELHRSGIELFASIYQNPEAAALYDLALYDATEAESQFYRNEIENGNDYAPIVITGGGGIYGTIFGSSFLKYRPDIPPFGVDASRRRGGLWATSGDYFLDKKWWAMNSRNRPEDRTQSPVPGTPGNLNTLGDWANLQLPDISSRQYPTQNEFGRVIAHDNFQSVKLVTDSRLLKVQRNQDTSKKGKIKLEYEDAATKKRFFVYTDYHLQATGLGEENYGFKDTDAVTQQVLDQAQQTFDEGVTTPKVSTFLQLVERTTDNRSPFPRQEYKKIGIIGRGDTSRVIREYLLGIEVEDGKSSAQLDFVDEIYVFGEFDTVKEELLKDERCRYSKGVLEFKREGGGFFRVRGVEGRVVGLADNPEGVTVLYRQEEEIPGGKLGNIKSLMVPKLITAAGFEDRSQQIYSAVNATTVRDKAQISRDIQKYARTPGTTVYFRPKSDTLLRRAEIGNVDTVGPTAKLGVTIIEPDGQVRRQIQINLAPDISTPAFLDPNQIEMVEVPQAGPVFSPLIDPTFDSEIPIAEQAGDLPLYRIGAATRYDLTPKERERTDAYKKIPANTKSVFRFALPVQACAGRIAKEITNTPADGLQSAAYLPEIPPIPDDKTSPEPKSLTIPLNAKAAVQRLPNQISSGNLVKYLAATRLRYRFPEKLREITLTVQREPDQLKITIAPPFPDNQPFDRAITNFASDPLVQRLIIRLTQGVLSRAAELNIPISNGMVNVPRVGAIPLRK